MLKIKNLNLFVIFLVTLLILIPSAKSSDECFEKTSRAVFNFNMALDNAIIEPIAKGYNKLLIQLKIVRVTLHQILELCCRS